MMKLDSFWLKVTLVNQSHIKHMTSWNPPPHQLIATNSPSLVWNLRSIRKLKRCYSIRQTYARLAWWSQITWRKCPMEQLVYSCWVRSENCNRSQRRRFAVMSRPWRWIQPCGVRMRDCVLWRLMRLSHKSSSLRNIPIFVPWTMPSRKMRL